MSAYVCGGNAPPGLSAHIKEHARTHGAECALSGTYQVERAMPMLTSGVPVLFCMSICRYVYVGSSMSLSMCLSLCLMCLPGARENPPT